LATLESVDASKETLETLEALEASIANENVRTAYQKWHEAHAARKANAVVQKDED
jgi:hypothetical protein